MIDRVNQPQTIIRTTNNKNNNNVSFKGPVTAVLTGLRGLNNSPAIGACAVDFCSMVTPRTVLETLNRGLQSGFETFFREVSSCLIHACVGLIGLGAATLLSGKFNNEYGVKAQEIFASSDTINNMASLWKNSGGDTKQYFTGFLRSIKGLNGSTWQGVSKDAECEIINNLMKLAEKSAELSTKTGADKKALRAEVKELKNLVSAQITKNTGASAAYRLETDGALKSVSASASDLIDNAVILGNSFKQQASDKLPKFVNALAKNKTASTLLGLGICAALCVSIQPLNRYLTKRRTGQDGFVGGESKKADNSKEFKTIKTILGLAFPAFAIKTIGQLSDLVPNVQFNSKIPTINQFKFLYGLTIGSRFLAARDKDELREATIKDTLGFTNWLILGGMVSKLTARALGGKELINNPMAEETGKKGIKYAAKWLTKTSVKSFDEVLLPTAKELTKDGKLMKFSELYNAADKATKAKVLKIGGSQIAGYLYSGLVLGIGIAKLNIHITRKLEAKRHEKEDLQEVSRYSGMNYISQAQKQSNSIFNDFN